MKRRTFISLAGLAASLGIPLVGKAASARTAAAPIAHISEGRSSQKRDPLVIKVIGVGGCGGNLVDYMIAKGVSGVDFATVNTDLLALRRTKARFQLQIGANATNGLGARANPETGLQAALEDRAGIIDLIRGADVLFLTAGMGGGTGTGAAPVVAEVAHELGILTVAVVTKPFMFEGRRQHQAELGLLKLAQSADYLITVSNDKSVESLGDQVTLDEAFLSTQNVIKEAIVEIATNLARLGQSGIDLQDSRAVKNAIYIPMANSRAKMTIGWEVYRGEKEPTKPLAKVIDIRSARKGLS